jgi:CBS domain-containing protein
MPTVEQVMTRDVVALDPDMTLAEMDEVLLERGVGGAPVVAGDQLLGVVSRADVIRVLYEVQAETQRVSDFYTSPFPLSIRSLGDLASDSRKIAESMVKRRVRELIRRHPISVRPSDDVRAVARLMASERIHRVPVVLEGRLVGIVSALDLVRLMAETGLADSE